MVQSIIRLTKAETIGAYVETIEGRIRALSTAHALLSESRWEGADLGRLVDEELAPYRQGELERIAWSGPAAFLQPSSAQIVALVLHELATNAAKYGAMSTPPGRVSVNWQLSQNVLTMTWQEANGPRVQAPKAKGYGTKVINASVVQQLGGTINFDWQEDGLRFTMTAPIGTAEPTRVATQKRRTAPNDQIHLAADKNSERRLLLVEDEALVGMMMKDALTELGFIVLGPFGRVADAMPAAHKEAFHAAILDINVKGELIYGLADAIAARDIPMVFVTGYGAETVEERFRAVPVLQKPIDRNALERVLASKKIGTWRFGEVIAASGEPNA